MPESNADLPARVAEAVIAHGVDAVEAAVVQEHVSQAGYTVRHNQLLRDLLAVDSEAAIGARALLSGMDLASVDAVVKAFELLVPEDEAKQNGAVFTPLAITRFLAERAVAGAGPDATVVDPACGCGALLVAALRELHAQSGRPATSIIAQQIFGMDLAAESLGRARLLLALTAVALGDDRELFDDNLVVGDSLEADWTEAPGSGQYDIVLGNPPYVRFQHLPVEARARLATRWSTLSKGNFNLYFAFFELAHQLRRPGGVVAFITPNAFFTASSAEPLRAWMAETGFVSELVDFGHTRVFDAMTYTTITISDQSAEGAGSYRRVSDVNQLLSVDAVPAQPIGADDLHPKGWRLVGGETMAAIQLIETTGRPLADVADVRFGVATLRDKLYQLSGRQDADGNYLAVFDGAAFTIEAEATVSFVKVPDVADECALAGSTKRIIYPYDLDGGRAVAWSEERLRDVFPLTATYFDAIRSELAKRDKGSKVYASWFAYGRTQGLVPVADKILTPLYSDRPRMLRDRSGRLFSNGCAITASDEVSLDVLAAILRSGVLHFYISQTSNAITGGYFAYQKRQLANFGVPSLSPGEAAALLAASDREADEMLAGIYGIELPVRNLRP